MDANPVLYLGDTSLSGAAGYLAGLMTHVGIRYDYLPSDQVLSSELASVARRLFILSDYPAANMPAAVQEIVLEQVRDHGAGLLMIGGWESYHGHGGSWDGSPIADALPVEISSEDDRINCDQPALLIASEIHPITVGLPWDLRPPTVGGFNRTVAKPGAATVLLAQRFQATYERAQFRFTPADENPMLVLGAAGRGRTAALMTDLAPHWVGGLVDWGDGERVTAQAPGSWQIEVGNLYSQFVANLLAWTGQFKSGSIE